MPTISLDMAKSNWKRSNDQLLVEGIVHCQTGKSILKGLPEFLLFSMGSGCVLTKTRGTQRQRNISVWKKTWDLEFSEHLL